LQRLLRKLWTLDVAVLVLTNKMFVTIPLKAQKS